MMLLRTVFFIFSVILCVNGAKILGIFPLTGSSHILTSSLMVALAEKGHEVTNINTLGVKNPPKNYRDIILKGFEEEAKEKIKEMNLFDMESSNQFVSMLVIGKLMVDMNEKVFQDPQVDALIKSDEKFDIVITVQFFNDAFKAFAPHFGASLIMLSSVGSNDWVNSIVGNPQPPSYVVQLHTGYSPPMTFMERLSNTITIAVIRLQYHLYVYPKSDQMIRTYISKDLSLYDVLYNTSLVLLNSHPSISQAVPHVPNMIEIGGFHIKPPKKLPQDLQKFLDEATDGVIYFSMGSNLKSAQLPPKKRDAFLNVFRGLKQKVLWKFEDDNLPGKPDNVHIREWMPQNDILAHPNVKMFITHGGLLSTTETVYHGVPILAIPIFGDQKANAKMATANGIGLTLFYSELTETNLREALTELLQNPKYTNTVKNRSRLYHDQETKPMDRAIYWVEYVARHKGAPHLRVAGIDLPWYQYHLLDIFTALGLIAGSILYCIYFIVNRYCCKCKDNECNKTKQVSATKKTKKGGKID